MTDLERVVERFKSESRVGRKIATGNGIGMCDGTTEGEMRGTMVAMANALDQAIALLEAGKWRPIETAPKNMKIIWVADEKTMRLAYWSDDRWRDFFGVFPRLDVLLTPTHWRPIPELPARPPSAAPGTPSG